MDRRGFDSAIALGHLVNCGVGRQIVKNLGVGRRLAVGTHGIRRRVKQDLGCGRQAAGPLHIHGHFKLICHVLARATLHVGHAEIDHALGKPALRHEFAQIGSAWNRVANDGNGLAGASEIDWSLINSSHGCRSDCIITICLQLLAPGRARMADQMRLKTSYARDNPGDFIRH